jgi:hypothetical protein
MDEVERYEGVILVSYVGFEDEYLSGDSEDVVCVGLGVG